MCYEATLDLTTCLQRLDDMMTCKECGQVVKLTRTYE